MPGRNYSSTSYRYGFNGKENDNEVKNVTGSQQDYSKRIYDPRLGRFLSVDPITKKYPELTSYQFGSDNPIQNIDLDGLEGIRPFFLRPLFYWPAFNAMDASLKKGESSSTALLKGTGAALKPISYAFVSAGILTLNPLAITLGIPAVGLKTTKDVASVIKPNDKAIQDAPDGVIGAVGMVADKVREKTTGEKSTTLQAVGSFVEAAIGGKRLLDRPQTLVQALDYANTATSIVQTGSEVIGKIVETKATTSAPVSGSSKVAPVAFTSEIEGYH